MSVFRMRTPHGEWRERGAGDVRERVAGERGRGGRCAGEAGEMTEREAGESGHTP